MPYVSEETSVILKNFYATLYPVGYLSTLLHNWIQ